MKFLLDTNILIYCIKNRPPKVLSKLQELDPSEVAVSAISVAELFFGAFNSNGPQKNLDAMKLFLSPFTIIPFGNDEAEDYGKIRADLSKKGTPIGANDFLIAASALKHSLTLVTNNVKEFERIDGLPIENWAQ